MFTRNIRRFNVRIHSESTGVTMIEKSVRRTIGVERVIEDAIEMAQLAGIDERDLVVSVTQRFEDETTRTTVRYLEQTHAAA